MLDFFQNFIKNIRRMFCRIFCRQIDNEDLVYVLIPNNNMMND